MLDGKISWFFFFLESFQTWNNWRYLFWTSRWWSLSDSAGYFSMCPHLSTAHRKKESYIGLVYLKIWCVISVFWGWNVTDGPVCLLWASSSLCDMSQGTWWFALCAIGGWGRSVCPKEKLINSTLFTSVQVKRSSSCGQWMSTFRKVWVEWRSPLCRWMLVCTFFHLPLIIVGMHP